MITAYANRDNCPNSKMKICSNVVAVHKHINIELLGRSDVWRNMAIFQFCINLSRVCQYQDLNSYIPYLCRQQTFLEQNSACVVTSMHNQFCACNCIDKESFTYAYSDQIKTHLKEVYAATKIITIKQICSNKETAVYSVNDTRKSNTSSFDWMKLLVVRNKWWL